MFQYHCLNPIAQKGLDIFDDNYKKADTLDDCQAVLVRSAKMHDMELPESVAVIARAGAGVNNIPVKECAEKGIVVFNTPGANANGGKELLISLLRNRRNSLQAVRSWAKSLVSSVLVLSEAWWQMQQLPLGWRFMDMIHTFPSMQHGTFPVLLSTARA